MVQLFSLPTTPSISIARARPATASAALPFGSGFVDVDIPPSDLCAVERRDRFFIVFVVRHFYKSEASRTTRVTVGHDRNAIYRAVWAKQLSQMVFGGVEIEIAYKDVLHQIHPLFVSYLNVGVRTAGATESESLVRCAKICTAAAETVRPVTALKFTTSEKLGSKSVWILVAKPIACGSASPIWPENVTITSFSFGSTVYFTPNAAPSIEALSAYTSGGVIGFPAEVLVVSGSKGLS